MRVWVGHERLRAQKKTERWGRGSAKGGEGGVDPWSLEGTVPGCLSVKFSD